MTDSTVDLRDLSPNRTLVLINGLRLATGESRVAGAIADPGAPPLAQVEADP